MINDEETLFGSACTQRRKVNKREKTYRIVVLTLLILIVLSQISFWIFFKIAYDNITSLSIFFESLFSSMNGDFSKINDLMNFIIDNEDGLIQFINSLDTIDDASSCIVNTFDC